ncbi:MAG: hypothetical protein BroJett018_24470 [Chloroflexota bacterium]|nr:MAG: hypothetical protein BroJett018_24470 [Chloroflexota bacterium]
MYLTERFDEFKGYDMFDKLQIRLTELKREFERNQQVLLNIEKQSPQLRDSLARIEGAIQVLEEELGLLDANQSEASSENKDDED